MFWALGIKTPTAYHSILAKQLALYARSLKKTNLAELRNLIESFVDGALEEKKKPLPYSERVKMK